MPIRTISPREASTLLESDPSTVYLDVRSVEEFAQGHPRGALNVPLLHREPATGQMVSNQQFLEVVKANFPPDTNMILGCMSGGRSRMAAEVLVRAGYSDLSNVRGGFAGARDPMGRVVEPGWAAEGLPVGREERAGQSYQSLYERVASS